MDGPRRSIGEFEQLVLLSVLRLGVEAYGIQLRRMIQEDGARTISRGALYKTLERLCDKELLAWEVSDCTPARGGLPRRRFRVTTAGLAALRHTKATLERFWSDVGEALG